MQFAVGDKVVHPRIGAGQITGTSRQELVAGFESYYIIDIPGKESTIYIPMSKVEELGVRPVMSQARLGRILKALSSTPQELPEDAKERQRDIQEKLRTGNPMQIAETMRDLTWHRHIASLTQKDEELFSQGRDFLAAEMALVAETSIQEIQTRISIALEVLLNHDLAES